MANIYVSIDPCWSYNFFGGIKDELVNIDYFQFTDKVYRCASDYVRLTHNFRKTSIANLYNTSVQTIWEDLANYGIHVSYFQFMFRTLLNNHLSVFNALPGCIHKVHTITSDVGDLTGFIFEV